MLYANVIDRILLETDESFVEAVGADAQARFYFHGALGELLQGGDYKTEEILQLAVMEEHTFDDTENGMITLSKLTDNNVIYLKSVFPDMDGASGLTVAPELLDRVAMYAYDREMIPNGNQVKYWQVGQNIYLRPTAKIKDKKFMFILILSPLPWADTPTANYWDNTTDMLSWFSFPFLNKAINLAIRLMSENVE